MVGGAGGFLKGVAFNSGVLFSPRNRRVLEDPDWPGIFLKNISLIGFFHLLVCVFHLCHSCSLRYLRIMEQPR